MSRINEQARHKPHKPETVTKECPIIVAESGSPNAPSPKRKEDATPILYLNRV
ncbi:MAG TPA: hypothetical protein VK536_06975 [Candidatus Limnocylindrales bacterium]|nr:hypothetical protein [Candidatus Limnocylindrales bacterium]